MEITFKNKNSCQEALQEFVGKEIKEIEKWTKVLFVKFIKGSPRFVSIKKFFGFLATRPQKIIISAKQFAEKLANMVSKETEFLDAKVWAVESRVRVYVFQFKRTGYKSKKHDYGYVEITNDPEAKKVDTADIYYHVDSNVLGHVDLLVDKLLEIYDIAPFKD